MGFGKYAVTNLAASRPIALRKCWICVVLCCVVLGTELHGFSDIGGAKVDHHWICVTINNIGVMRVSIRNRVFLFHHLHRGEKWVSESVSEWVVVAGTLEVISIMARPYAVTEAEICRHGNLPTTAPVKPYTEFALTFNANCLPFNTAYSIICKKINELWVK